MKDITVAILRRLYRDIDGRSGMDMGQADWLFNHEGRSFLVYVWKQAFAETNDAAKATEAVRRMAQSRGVDPKIHRVHAR